MGHWFDRIDGFLGRLFFRAVGLLCAAVSAVCVYAVWWHLTHWNPEYSLWPTLMFSLAAIAGGSVVPYCSSRKRSFGEALDAMEGGTRDMHRRK